MGPVQELFNAALSVSVGIVSAFLLNEWRRTLLSGCLGGCCLLFSVERLDPYTKQIQIQ